MTAPKRDKTIKVRVSSDELDVLRQRCPKARLAEWMREQCLEPEGVRSRKTRTAPAIDPALLRQLASIGNNLNQIARRVNSGEWGALDRLHVVAALTAIERGLIALKEDAQ